MENLEIKWADAISVEDMIFFAELESHQKYNNYQTMFLATYVLWEIKKIII